MVTPKLQVAPGAVVALVAALAASLLLLGTGAAASGANPIVSRGVPAYATNAIFPPGRANNSTYFDMAACTPPCFVALDLSPAGALGNVQLAWYNIATTFSHDLCCGPGYGLPSNYTLDANAAPGGSLPSGGWVTLASVTGNHHNAGEFNLNVSGYHWLRMNVTLVDGSPGNTDALFEIDVQTGPNDSWLFGGDSITDGAMTQDESYGGALATNQPNFAQQVNAVFPSQFPLQIDAGVGGITAKVVAGTYQMNGTKGGGHDYMKDWLAAFPSHYVTLNYGTNDAGGSLADYYQAMSILVQDVLAAGRVPIVPMIPWRCSPDVSPENQQIAALYAAFPQVVHGPDLYSLWKNSSDIIGNDCLHPSFPNGMAKLRSQWGQWAIANVYGAQPSPPPTVSAVAPTSGPAAGGTSVTITGTNLIGASAVKFGTVAATPYTVNSATQITATSPPGSGTVDVTVTTVGGPSAITTADRFKYTPAPTVVSVAPNTGLTGGGTPVTITGTNFTGATAVKFGTGTATYMVTSATQITATSSPGSGNVDVTVTTPAGTSAISATDKFAYTSPPAAYTAQSPNRILDTRASGQMLSGGGSLNLTVAGGTTGVPATATGVILNITVTNTTAPSFLTVWPAGSPRATVSNLNWVAGETRANLVNVSVGAGGQVSIYNGVGSADVVVDEEGYFAAPVGMAGGYNSLTPARLLDTRSSAQTMSTGSTIDLQVLGAGGVPATGVSAVVLNVTATNTATQGYFTVFPSGTSRPTASNVNWAARWTLPNRVIVKVGTNGKVSIYNGRGAADAVVDVSGYFSDATASGKFFTQVSPVRVLDTRISDGTLGPSGTYPNFQLIGNDGVPTGATAVFLNATVTNTTASSFLTAFPNARPTASDLNWVAGQTIPNSTLATLSSTGTSSFYNGVGWTDLVLDLSGWFS